MLMKQPAELWKDYTLGKSACHPSDHLKHNPYACTFMVSWIFLLACWEFWSSGCAYKYLRPLREGSVSPYHATSSSSSWHVLRSWPFCDVAAGLVGIKPLSSAITHCPNVAGDMTSGLLLDQTARMCMIRNAQDEQKNHGYFQLADSWVMPSWCR